MHAPAADGALSARRVDALDQAPDAGAVAALEAAGGDLDAMLAEIVLDPHGVSVLLVGSLAEGRLAPACGADLLVLADSPADRRRRAPGVVRSDRSSSEHRVRIAGLDLNVELAFRSEMRAIVGTFLELAPLLYRPESVTWLPRLDAGQVRLLHRLRTGAVWRGPRRVELWRDELYVTLLGPYLALVHAADLDRRAEAAIVVHGHDGTALAMAGRAVAESALLATLASVGGTDPSVRAAVARVSTVTDAAARALAEDAVRALFPPPEIAPAAAPAYVEALDGLRAGVGARLDAVGLGPARRAVAALTPTPVG
jgi:hypothetical protein